MYYPPSMALDFKHSIEIDLPAQQVFDYVAKDYRALKELLEDARA
jgi:hypothetical protein